MTTTIMHLSILWLCGAIAVAVFAVMIHSVATFAGESGGSPAKYRRGPFVEVLWAIIPIVIVVALAVPAVSPTVRSELAAQQAAADGAQVEPHIEQYNAYHDGRDP